MDRLKTILALTFVLIGIPAMAIAAVALFVVANASDETTPDPPAWDESLQTLPVEPTPAPEPPEPEPEPVAPEPEPEPEPEPALELDILGGVCSRDTQVVRSRLRRSVGGRARICGIAVGNKTGDFASLLEKTLAIEFTLEPNGGVTDISLAGKMGRDRELVECLEMAFSELRPGAHDAVCRFTWRLPMRPDRLNDTLDIVERSSLTREDVVEGARGNTRSLVRCLNRARRRGELETGRYILRFDWTIRPDGSVEGGRLVGPEQLLEGKLSTCVAGAMRKWKFPKGLSAVSVANFTIGPIDIE